MFHFFHRGEHAERRRRHASKRARATLPRALRTPCTLPGTAPPALAMRAHARRPADTVTAAAPLRTRLLTCAHAHTQACALAPRWAMREAASCRPGSRQRHSDRPAHERVREGKQGDAKTCSTTANLVAAATERGEEDRARWVGRACRHAEHGPFRQHDARRHEVADTLDHHEKRPAQRLT